MDIDNTMMNDMHYIHPDVDCGGHLINGYWRTFGTTKDGHTICANGYSPEEAYNDLIKQQNERDNFVNQPAKDKIKQLITNGCRGTVEQDDLNKAFAQLLGITI
jgi:hypothetical protein